jgi:hypothetical protein
MPPSSLKSQPPMHHKSKKFKALQKVWYDKLKKDGFSDIEQEDGKLKAWSSSFTALAKNTVLREAKTEYYRLVGQFLYDHEFDNALEKYVWELHAEAMGSRGIVKKLRSMGAKVTDKMVLKTIRRLVAEMRGKCFKKPTS